MARNEARSERVDGNITTTAEALDSSPSALTAAMQSLHPEYALSQAAITTAMQTHPLFRSKKKSNKQVADEAAAMYCMLIGVPEQKMAEEQKQEFAHLQTYLMLESAENKSGPNPAHSMAIHTARDQAAKTTEAKQRSVRDDMKLATRRPDLISGWDEELRWDNDDTLHAPRDNFSAILGTRLILMFAQRHPGVPILYRVGKKGNAPARPQALQAVLTATQLGARISLSYKGKPVDRPTSRFNTSNHPNLGTDITTAVRINHTQFAAQAALGGCTADPIATALLTYRHLQQLNYPDDVAPVFGKKTKAYDKAEKLQAMGQQDAEAYVSMLAPSTQAVLLSGTADKALADALDGHLDGDASSEAVLKNMRTALKAYLSQTPNQRRLHVKAPAVVEYDDKGYPSFRANRGFLFSAGDAWSRIPILGGLVDTESKRKQGSTWFNGDDSKSQHNAALAQRLHRCMSSCPTIEDFRRTAELYALICRPGKDHLATHQNATWQQAQVFINAAPETAPDGEETQVSRHEAITPLLTKLGLMPGSAAPNAEAGHVNEEQAPAARRLSRPPRPSAPTREQVEDAEGAHTKTPSLV